MPAQQFTEEETWMLIAYLRSLSPLSTAPESGNIEAGKKIFFGKGLCVHCHMVGGQGGRLGPDLSRIGASRAPRFLIKSIREPHRDFSEVYPTVTLVTKDGQRITGVPRNEDTFSIQVMDQAEELHLYLKKDLKEVIHQQESLMPVYDERMLSKSELQDLLSYLQTLRGN